QVPEVAARAPVHVTGGVFSGAALLCAVAGASIHDVCGASKSFRWSTPERLLNGYFQSHDQPLAYGLRKVTLPSASSRKKLPPSALPCKSAADLPSLFRREKVVPFSPPYI